MPHHDVQGHLQLAEEMDHLGIQGLLCLCLLAGLLGFLSLAWSGLILILVSSSLVLQTGHIHGDHLVIAAVLATVDNSPLGAFGLLLLLLLLVSLGLFC